MIQLSYIESTGTQYINTGINGNQFTRIETEILPSSTSLYENSFICSSWTIEGPLLITYRNVWRWHAGKSADSSTIDTNNYSILELDLTGFSVNGNRYDFIGTGATTSNPIYLFNRVGSSGRNGFGKIKYFRVFQNNTLIQNLIPVKDDNDVVCFYDTISQSYFYNGGTGDFIAGDPLIPYYTVNFNGNGGTGYMNPQNINIDTEEELTINSFIRDGYIFKGWSTTATGNVEYTDGETVYNLTQPYETITLYAVWEESPMAIILQTNTSEHNKLYKEITPIQSFYGTLKDETSLINPKIILYGDLGVISSANYITIPKFNRSYFINEYKSIRQGLVEISCHVDVLYTYRNIIKQQNAIIRRQENEWNLYLNDGSFKVYQNPLVLTKAFPNGFNTQEFVLAVAGS